MLAGLVRDAKLPSELKAALKIQVKKCQMEKATEYRPSNESVIANREDMKRTLINNVLLAITFSFFDIDKNFDPRIVRFGLTGMAFMMFSALTTWLENMYLLQATEPSPQPGPSRFVAGARR